MHEEGVAAGAAREPQHRVDAGADLEEIVALATVGDDRRHPREYPLDALTSHADAAGNHGPAHIPHGVDPEGFVLDAAIPLAAGIAIPFGIVAGREREHAAGEPGDDGIGPLAAGAPITLPGKLDRDRDPEDLQPRAHRGGRRSKGHERAERRPVTTPEPAPVVPRGPGHLAAERGRPGGVATEREGQVAHDRDVEGGELGAAECCEQIRPVRAVEAADVEPGHTKKVERAAVDADLEDIARAEHPPTDVEPEQAQVDRGGQAGVEVGVGLGDGAVGERDVGGARIDEQSAVDRGEAGGPAGELGVEHEGDLARIGIAEHPHVTAGRKRAEADVRLGGDRSADAVAVEEQAQRAGEHGAPGHDPSGTGERDIAPGHRASGRNRRDDDLARPARLPQALGNRVGHVAAGGVEHELEGVGLEAGKRADREVVHVEQRPGGHALTVGHEHDLDVGGHMEPVGRADPARAVEEQAERGGIDGEVEHAIEHDCIAEIELRGPLCPDEGPVERQHDRLGGPGRGDRIAGPLAHRAVGGDDRVP